MRGNANLLLTSAVQAMNITAFNPYLNPVYFVPPKCPNQTDIKSRKEYQTMAYDPSYAMDLVEILA